MADATEPAVLKALWAGATLCGFESRVVQSFKDAWLSKFGRFEMTRDVLQRPVIALTPQWDETEDRYGLRRRYFASLIEAGAVPVMLPLGIEPEAIEEVLKRVDGVLITGGEDIDPACYGAEATELCGRTSPARDALENVVVRWCLKHKLPMLGICRGMQAMNVFAGGTLIEDIPRDLKSTVPHVQPEDYAVRTHPIVSLGSPLFERIAGGTRLEVNSRHHQCVARPAPGAKILAECPIDHVPEAMVFEDHPFALAVQWHPEMLAHLHKEDRTVFELFVQACRRTR